MNHHRMMNPKTPYPLGKRGSKQFNAGKTIRTKSLRKTGPEISHTIQKRKKEKKGETPFGSNFLRRRERKQKRPRRESGNFPGKTKRELRRQADSFQAKKGKAGASPQRPVLVGKCPVNQGGYHVSSFQWIIERKGKKASKGRLLLSLEKRGKKPGSFLDSGSRLREKKKKTEKKERKTDLFSKSENEKEKGKKGEGALGGIAQ